VELEQAQRRHRRWGRAALWEEEAERRRGGRNEARGARRLWKVWVDGDGDFLVPVYVYDGRGIRLMWVGQAGLVCLGGSRSRRTWTEFCNGHILFIADIYCSCRVYE
jgi:hypothetical protein